MIRRLALAALLALAPSLACAQFATIAPTPAATDNGDRVATTAWVNLWSASAMPLANGKIWIGSVGGFATQQTPSGDWTITSAGVATVTQAAGNFNVLGNLAVTGTSAFTGGIVLGAPTGGNKGAGTVNLATDYYKNNVIIPETVSAPLTLSAAGLLACPSCVLVSATAHGDSVYAILSTDRYVYTNAAFTAPRTWTLPAANSLSAGTTIWVQDAQNTITTANTLTVSRAGADTIDIVNTTLVITGSGGGITFTTDGVSNWGTPIQTVTTGGSGQKTLTNHGVLVGAGANPITQTAVGATGTVLRGQTGADPVYGAVNMATDMTGVMLAAQEPAHTGDCTNSASSLALICLKTNNVSFTAGATAAAGQLPGEPSNGSASAGNVGQYIESVIVSGSAVAVTTGTQVNVTSISLTAGDWDVDAVAYLLPAATTSVTRYAASVSTVSATVQTAPGQFVDFSTPAIVTGGLTLNDVIPPYRFSLSGTTTIFLVVLNTFTVSTAAEYGIIRARRVR